MWWGSRGEEGLLHLGWRTRGWGCVPVYGDLAVEIQLPEFIKCEIEFNRAVFRAQPADDLGLAGIALRGPKKAVDKAVKGRSLHP